MRPFLWMERANADGNGKIMAGKIIEKIIRWLTWSLRILPWAHFGPTSFAEDCLREGWVLMIGQPLPLEPKGRLDKDEMRSSHAAFAFS